MSEIEVLSQHLLIGIAGVVMGAPLGKIFCQPVGYFKVVVHQVVSPAKDNFTRSFLTSKSVYLRPDSFGGSMWSD